MAPLPFSTDRIPDFCRRWKVREFGIFGSAATGAATQASDVDVLLTFDPDSTWTLLDIAAMSEELRAMFGRPVDIVEEAAVRNPYMLESIRRSKRVLYAA